MQEVVIASAARLPVGKLGGTLLYTDEKDMGSLVIKESMRRAGIRPEDVNELIMGQNFKTGLISSNSTRVMAIEAGIPMEIPQFTINKHCGAGIKSIILATQAIKSGDAEIIVAGGIDQMSKAAHFAIGARWGVKVGHLQLKDQLVMQDPVCGLTTGQAAEKLARIYNISRQEQDEFAFWSQQKTEKAIKDGKFKDEIIPIQVEMKSGNTVLFDTDESPRFGTTLEKLAKLASAFAENGTVTAGNSSSMNDGASAMVVMSMEKAKRLDIKPLAKIVSYSAVGVEPSMFTTAPVPSTKIALEKAGLTIDDMDLIELNEAFACQSIYYTREIKPNLDRLNVNGGAIALGHPIAATGNVILTKLLYELKRRGGKYGLATMCIGGGLGISIIVDGEIG